MGVDRVWTVVSFEFAGDGMVSGPCGIECGDGSGADLVEHCGNGAGLYIGPYGIDGESWAGGGGRVCGDSFDGEGGADLSEARGAGDREFDVTGGTSDRDDAGFVYREFLYSELGMAECVFCGGLAGAFVDSIVVVGVEEGTGAGGDAGVERV